MTKSYCYLTFCDNIESIDASDSAFVLSASSGDSDRRQPVHDTERFRI